MSGSALDNFSRRCVFTFFYHHTDIYTCIDTSMHVVSHNHSEFSPARIKNLAFHPYFYIFPVVAEICNFRARSEITTAPDYAISYITQVPHMGTLHDYRILDFNGISNPSVVSNCCGRTDEAVRLSLIHISEPTRPY